MYVYMLLNIWSVGHELILQCLFCCFSVTEEQCLNEIYIDEHFGPPVKTGEEEKKK